MHKKTFQIILLGLLFSFLVFPVFPQTKKKAIASKQSVISAMPVDDEEYEVYSALFQDLYNNKAITLENQVSACTGVGNNNEGEASWQKSLDGLSRKLIKLHAKTMADFKGKSRLCRTLDARFTTSVRLISKSERRVIFSGKDMRKAWTAFHKKFPGPNGYVIVSNIGFNEDRTQALVDVSNKCGDQCGAEQFVLLTKAKGSWSVSGMQVLWQL